MPAPGAPSRRLIVLLLLYTPCFYTRLEAVEGNKHTTAQLHLGLCARAPPALWSNSALHPSKR